MNYHNARVLDHALLSAALFIKRGPLHRFSNHRAPAPEVAGGSALLCWATVAAVWLAIQAGLPPHHPAHGYLQQMADVITSRTAAICDATASASAGP